MDVSTIRDCCGCLLRETRLTCDDVTEAQAYIFTRPDFRFISDRLTKGRPKSFEDIAYRPIRCLICVETWTRTPSVIDNASAIADGSDDHETCYSFWLSLIGYHVFVLMSVQVLLNQDRQTDDKKKCSHFDSFA